MATENHGGERRVLRIKCALRGSRFASLCTVGAVTIAVLGVKLGFLPLVLTGAAVVMAVAMVRECLSLGRMLHATLQTVARRARLHHARRLQDQPAEVQ